LGSGTRVDEHLCGFPTWDFTGVLIIFQMPLLVTQMGTTGLEIGKHDHSSEKSGWRSSQARISWWVACWSRHTPGAGVFLHNTAKPQFFCMCGPHQGPT